MQTRLKNLTRSLADNTEADSTGFSRETDWYRLRLFNYFRGSLALFFITIYFNGWLEQLLPPSHLHPTLFLTTSICLTLACIIFMYSISHQKPNLEAQVIAQTIIDITAIILLMHATGGIRTGLGMLLIISTSMTSLFLKKRLTILFAAIATLSILAEQSISKFFDPDYSSAFTQAGILGALIFISALLTTYITKHLRESEQLAQDASQELESVVQMNEHIIHNMRTGIMVLSNNGIILMANNAAARLLSYSNIARHSRLESISPLLNERFQEWLNDNIQNHQPVPQSHGLPDIQPGFSQIERNHDGSGKTLLFLEDATQLTQRFQQVKLASLGRLTASIAHEIRNPLAAINHAGQLLGESAENPADIKLTQIINTQTKRLNGIVENVLQLSRQQRGNIENINLYSWLQNFRDEFHVNQGIHAYQLHIQIKPETLNVLFDNNQLHQVLWNLCSNAINHSNMDISNIMINIQGGIDEELSQPYIDVIDNGPGIDKETQAHIFEPFFTTRSDGTGLGLYITKEIIETNRAKIRYIDLETGGTCFRIIFLEAETNAMTGTTKPPPV